NPAELEKINIPISFTLPLAAPLTDESEGTEEACGEPEATRTLKCQVHFILGNGKEFLRPVGTEANQEAEQSVCPGSVAAPKAKPGNLCLYTTIAFFNIEFLSFSKPSAPGNPGTDTAGAKLSLVGLSEAPRVVTGGTWAVTAE